MDICKKNERYRAYKYSCIQNTRKFITNPKEKANILVKQYQKASSNTGYSEAFINITQKNDYKINKKNRQ